MAARRISLVVLAPFLVVGAVLAYATRELAVERDHALERAATTASDVARMIGERVDRSLIMVEFLLDETTDDLAMEPGSLRQVLRQRQAYAGVIDRITVYDGTLRPIASTLPTSVSDVVLQCYDDADTARVQVHAMRGDACPFSVTRTVAGEDGRVARIMLAQLSPSVLGDLFELERELGPGSRIALLDQTASPLLTAPGELAVQAVRAMADRVGTGFTAHGRRSFIGDDLVIGLYQLPSYPMRLVVGIATPHVLGIWRQGLRATFFFAAVLVLGAAAWALLAHVWQGRRQVLEMRLRDEELQRLRAEEASRTKSHFLQYMSHELRTPLNAILGFSEIIRDRILGNAPERYAEYAADIHASGQILLEIINDLLQIAKIEAGKLDLRKDAVPLHEIAREAADLMRTQVRKADLVIREDLDPCIALGDRRAVLQILLNLLSNAVKYTPAGGCITLRARQASRARFEIEDTGRGMDAATLARVMKPFEQADNRLDLAQVGTGLGLAVTGALVSRMGGDLKLSSTPGVGTVASFELPPAIGAADETLAVAASE